MADREYSGGVRRTSTAARRLGGIRRSLGFKRRRPRSPTPGPMKVSRGAIALGALGTQTVNFVRGKSPLAVIDTPLSA